MREGGKKGTRDKEWTAAYIKGKSRMETVLSVCFLLTKVKEILESRSVVSDSLPPHELYSPWNSVGQNTGVGSLSLLQGIFPTQGSNPGLLSCRWTLTS